MTFRTSDITPRIATELRAEKEELLRGVHAAEIRELLEQRGVLVFPEIGFTDDEQVDDSAQFDGLAAYIRSSMYAWEWSGI